MLPAGSAYWAARGDDDELADAAVAQLGDEVLTPKRSSPPLVEMTRTNQLLTDVVDGLSGVAARLDAMAGGKGRVEPYPRPSTAMDRARRRAMQAQRSSLLEEVHISQERWRHGRE